MGVPVGDFKTPAGQLPNFVVKPCVTPPAVGADPIPPGTTTNRWQSGTERTSPPHHSRTEPDHPNPKSPAYEEKATPMKPSHHISRTRLYLKYAASDTAIGDYDRAAKALARATSHAATAVGVHWDYLCGLRGSRRRLQSALNELARKRYVSYGLAGVLREAYALPDLIATAAAKPASANARSANAHREIIRILRRTRMRARRLLKAIVRAMSDEPNPPTFDEIMARALVDHPEPISPTCVCHGARPVLCFGPAPPPSAPPAYGAPPLNPLY